MQTSPTKKRKLTNTSRSPAQRRKVTAQDKCPSNLSTSTAPSPSMDPPQIDLLSLSEPERQHLYKTTFNNIVVPLSHIETPEDAHTYPALCEEITDAYLTHTTFAVEVWINYDAIAKRFYTSSDQRFQDSGMIQLTPRQWASLQSSSFEVSKVKFEIYTPFTYLGSVDVKCPPRIYDGHETKLKTRVRVADSVEHPHVQDFLDDVADYISTCTLLPRQRGFTFANIQEIAGNFRRHQQEHEWDEYFEDPSASCWTFYERYGNAWTNGCTRWQLERNDGHVDFNALETSDNGFISFMDVDGGRTLGG